MSLPIEYEKLKFIGDGSFAKVYKVRHRTLRYIRAVKVNIQHIENESDPAYQKFLNECAVLLRIGSGAHPNIVRMFNPRLVDNSALVEMDYIEGETLCKYVERERWLPIDEVMRFAREILSAMAFCHRDVYRFVMDPASDGIKRDPNDASRLLISAEDRKRLIKRYQVIHNDLHSNNVMRRDYDGRYILLDFGLSIQNGDCVKSSSRNNGAPEYQSPEKIQNLEITTASDVYSLGILLYEVLTGSVPFPMRNVPGMSQEAIIVGIQDSHLHLTPPDPRKLRREAFEQKYPGREYVDDIPDGLVEIIMRCLAKRPADRFADAAELNDAFHKIDIPSHNESVDENLRAKLRRWKSEAKKAREELAEAREEIASLQAALPVVDDDVDESCYTLSEGEVYQLKNENEQLRADNDRILEAYWKLDEQYKTLTKKGSQSKHSESMTTSLSPLIRLVLLTIFIAALLTGIILVLNYF